MPIYPHHRPVLQISSISPNVRYKSTRKFLFHPKIVSFVTVWFAKEILYAGKW